MPSTCIRIAIDAHTRERIYQFEFLNFGSECSYCASLRSGYTHSYVYIYAYRIYACACVLQAHWSPNALVDALVDGDLGGTPNVFSPAASSGCSADYLVTAQHKSGVLFLLNASNLTEIGMYQIAAATGDLINEATYDPVTNLLFVTVPNKVSSSGSYPGIAGVSNGLLAMRVMPNCTLAVAYSVSLGITSTSGSYSSAVMANGVVYFSDGAGRKLHAVNASNGASVRIRATYYSLIVVYTHDR